jgi:bacterioferritin
VQLGGEPDFSPDFLSKRSDAPYNAELRLKSATKANLSAERVVIEAYTQMITLMGDKDSVPTVLIEDILSQQYEHADKLKNWLGIALK